MRVNAIAPDMADTLQTPAEAMLRGRDPDLIQSWIPLGHFGHPDEYGDVVLFLASDLSRFVTGHIVPRRRRHHCGERLVRPRRWPRLDQPSRSSVTSSLHLFVPIGRTNWPSNTRSFR